MSKILVVDDEIEVRNFLHNVLTGEGYEVTTVPTGEQMFKILQIETPDLILLDHKLERESGLSILRDLQRDKSLRIPVVIFSGHVTQALEIEAYEAGAIEVISKGGILLELREKVKKIIEAKHRIFAEHDRTRPPRKLLLVDDEKPILDLLEGFFSSKGYETLTARNGEEALALVQKAKPSVVLLDIMMPGMDGLLALKKIREVDKDVGVIIATSVYDENMTREATILGAYGYILKPFDFQYLEMVVMTRLEVVTA